MTPSEAPPRSAGPSLRLSIVLDRRRRRRSAIPTLHRRHRPDRPRRSTASIAIRGARHGARASRQGHLHRLRERARLVGSPFSHGRQRHDHARRRHGDRSRRRARRGVRSRRLRGRRCSDGGDRYVGAVRFTTPAAGDYTITRRATSRRRRCWSRARSPTRSRSVLVWFVLAGVGGARSWSSASSC